MREDWMHLTKKSNKILRMNWTMKVSNTEAFWFTGCALNGHNALINPNHKPSLADAICVQVRYG